MHSYDWTMLESHPAAAVEPMSDELAALVKASAYPTELIERALAARIDRGMVAGWVASGFPPPEHLEPFVELKEWLLESTLTPRVATWADDELLVDLCANSPETVGEWSVTVERSPNPYAQYRLQERAYVLILEDHQVGLGMSAASVRNTIIDGQRTSALFMSGWRIRNGFRGMGLSNLLRSSPGLGGSWFGLVTYWLARPRNASAGWLDKINAEMGDRTDDWAVDTETLTATIWDFTATDAAGTDDTLTIRPTEHRDLDTVRELINRTHEGLDLFRPYTHDYLEERLEDPTWGPKPFFVPEIYGWPEHRVVELDGEIVACGGLWDRGRDIREVWRRANEDGANEEVTVDPTALMDFGFAAGEQGVAAMAGLIRSFIADSAALGRSGLLAPLEFLPELRTALSDLESRAETRELTTMPFTSPDLTIDLTITKPYTDMAYW